MKKPIGNSRAKSRADSSDKPKRAYKATTDKRGKSDGRTDDKPAFRRKPKTEGSFDATKKVGKRDWSSDKPGEKKSFSSERGTDTKRPYAKRTDSGDAGSFRKRDTFKRTDDSTSIGSSERKPYRGKRDEFSSDKPEKRSYRGKDSFAGGEKIGSFRKRDDSAGSFKRSDSAGGFKRSEDKRSDFKRDDSKRDSFKRTYTKRDESGSEGSFGTSADAETKRPFNRNDFSTDRPEKKHYRGKDSSAGGEKTGSFRKRNDSAGSFKRSDSAGGFKRSEDKRSDFKRDDSKRGSFKRENKVGFDKSFRSRDKDFADKDTKPTKAGIPFGADDSQQIPPDYNLKKYENRKSKTKSKAKSKKLPGDDSIRLNRYISNAGICSRRDADVLIASGEIKVNGKVITEMGYQVKPGDSVKYGNRLLSREKMVYVLLNKPKDYITTTEDPEDRKTVMDLIKNASQERIYPVGRLDRNTTGLLVLTNDGELAEKLAHPSNNIQKLYEVELDRPITQLDFQQVLNGVELEDGKATVDDLAIVSPDKKSIGIALHLGRNRIVRRIFEHLGYTVERLDRTTYAGLTKKDLPRGHWRYLTEQEVIRLKFFV